MKVLLTGASGLLGSEIAFLLEQKGIETIKLCRRKRPGFVALELTDDDGLKGVAQLEWDTLIHAAALRDPDFCENEREATFALNVAVTAKLAEMAAARNGRMLYVSTDYVFPGADAPYREDAVPRAVNYYGRTKLEGEREVVRLCPRHTILRVPAMYGIRSGLANSPLITSTLKALKSADEVFLDDYIVKYPTFAGDAAAAAVFLLEKAVAGIFHFSASERATKYDQALLFSELTGLPRGHIRPLYPEPGTVNLRPVDSHLDCGKITRMGFPAPKPLRERVLELLTKIDPGFVFEEI